MDRFDDLSLAQLRTFDLVFRFGGYAAAARESHLSVPSVWQHIQALEKTYQVTLFQRVGRSVQPTEAATRLHRQIDPLLVQLESTFDIVSDSAPDQPIRIVAGARMMLEDLGVPLCQFKKSHPNALVIRHGSDRRAEELLLSDDADIALALEPVLERKVAEIHYEPAYTVEFLAVAKRTHPFMKSDSVKLADLAEHELVVTQKGTHGRDALDQAFDHEGLTARIVAETDNSAYTIACVAAGMGIGIVAGRSSGELTKKLATKSLSQQLGQRRLVLMWRKGRILPDAMIDLIEQLKSIHA